MTGSAAPAAPVCTPATPTAIEATWYSYAAAGAVAYELQYKPAGDTAWTSLEATRQWQATIGGLTTGTWYDLRVRYLLDLADPSPWSPPVFCWPLPEPVWGACPATPVEVYRNWVCQCECTGCRWYAPCGTGACRPRTRRRIVVATGGWGGFLDEMETAILDPADAADLGQALAEAAR